MQTQGHSCTLVEMTRSIPLELITLERTALRFGHDIEKLRLLSASIAQHGLLQPIVVRAGDEGKYLLIAGVRRFKACSHLGWTEIDCTVVESKFGDVVPGFVENIQRLQMSPTEEASACKYMQEKENMSVAEIADATNHGRSWVQQRLMLAEWPAYAQDPIGKKKLSIGSVALLMQIDDEELRKYYIQIGAANGCTAQQAQAWLYDFQNRQRMIQPEGVDGVMPELPPLPPPLTCPCFLCGEAFDPSMTVIIRSCLPCRQSLAEILEAPAPTEEPETNGGPPELPKETNKPNEEEFKPSRSARFVGN